MGGVIELRKTLIGGPTLFPTGEGNTTGYAIFASDRLALRSPRAQDAEKQHAREPEDLRCVSSTEDRDLSAKVQSHKADMHVSESLDSP